MKNKGSFLRKYSPSSRTGTLLPDFPNPKILQLPEMAPMEKVLPRRGFVSEDDLFKWIYDYFYIW